MFSEIEDSAALVLESNFTGMRLELNGLTNISDNTAKTLAKCNFNLSLEGIERLNDSNEHFLLLIKLVLQTEDLCLYNIKELSNNQAAIIATRENRLSLRSLTKLLDSSEHVLLAKCLAKYGNVSRIPPRLNLNGLIMLSDKAAEALAESEIFILSLNGLSNLSETTVSILSKRKCKYLYVEGLSSLTKGEASLLDRGGSFFLNEELKKRLQIKKN